MFTEDAEIFAEIEQADRIGEDCASRPLDFAKWTIPQGRFLRSCSKRKLFRAGNRSGKTRTCIADVVFRAYGEHPYRDVRPGPTHQWVVCVSWDQAVPIMKAFHELVDYRKVRKVREFREKDGYGKDSPLIEFENGSTVRFKTMDQGTRRHAGAELDHIFIDEPPSSAHYRELERRVSSTNGDVTIGLTPINAPEPLDWLIELVEKGVVEDHHVRMTPAAYTFEDGTVRRLGDGTVLDLDWIEDQRRIVLPRFAPVILDGEWNLRVEGNVFTAFDRDVHVTDDYPEDDWILCLGIDHGTGRDFSQVGILVMIQPSKAQGLYPKVWVLAEDITEGDTTPDQDAARYAAMLERFGWEWSDLDFVFGDKAHQGRWGGVSRKSNKDLEEEMVRILRLKSRSYLKPRIAQAKRGKGGGRGAVEWGSTWLHRSMLRDAHFKIHRSCKRLIDSIERWDFADNEWKHAIDALRYAVWEHSMRGRREGAATTYLY